MHSNKNCTISLPDNIHLTTPPRLPPHSFIPSSTLECGAHRRVCAVQCFMHATADGSVPRDVQPCSANHVHQRYLHRCMAQQRVRIEFDSVLYPSLQHSCASSWCGAARTFPMLTCAALVASSPIVTTGTTRTVSIYHRYVVV